MFIVFPLNCLGSIAVNFLITVFKLLIDTIELILSSNKIFATVIFNHKSILFTLYLYLAKKARVFNNNLKKFRTVIRILDIFNNNYLFTPPPFSEYTQCNFDIL